MFNKCKSCKKILEFEDRRKKYCNSQCYKEYNRKHNPIRDLKSTCYFLGCSNLATCLIDKNPYCKEHFNKLRYRTLSIKRRGRKKVNKF